MKKSHTSTRVLATLAGIALIGSIGYPVLRWLIKRIDSRTTSKPLFLQETHAKATGNVHPSSIGSTLRAGPFKLQQLTYPRVQAAVKEKEASLKSLFERKGFTYPPKKIFIRVFKKEQILELWVGKNGAEIFELIKEFKVCASSGDLGPKRKEGDGQVPEGFYHIERFNPKSNYHLSLGINYPNESDRILGTNGKLGGDIFIHGDCVTIGCVPVTDNGIKEIYLIAIEAKDAGQQSVPVHIFPTRLNQEGIKQLEQDYSGQEKLINFWLNLKKGYDLFEQNRKVPIVTVQKDGTYVFK
jgi:murein L,D-transpeptidase YafK